LKGTGKITKWKVEEFSHGLIIEDMKENILMIRKKEMEYFIGPMAESTKENGKMENSMDKENTHQLLVKRKEGSGLKERELLGSDHKFT
jgi:hypothetical protein